MNTAPGETPSVLRMFEQNEQSELKAMSTVLCHFGGKGGTAVLALMPSSDRIQMNGQAYYGVLIPDRTRPLWWCDTLRPGGLGGASGYYFRWPRQYLHVYGRHFRGLLAAPPDHATCG